MSKQTPASGGNQWQRLTTKQVREVLKQNGRDVTPGRIRQLVNQRKITNAEKIGRDWLVGYPVIYSERDGHRVYYYYKKCPTCQSVLNISASLNQGVATSSITGVQSCTDPWHVTGE